MAFGAVAKLLADEPPCIGKSFKVMRHGFDR